MNADLTLTLFTPGEAEKITGVSTVAQRDWRRRGYLPAAEGHARFDAFALAELWALKLLADRGIGPQQGKYVAGWIGAGIVWNALKWVDAYEGDHKECTSERRGGPAPRPIPDDLRRLIETAAEKVGIAVDLSDATRWRGAADWLAKQVFRLKKLPGVIPAQYFIWWADGSHIWHESLDAAFSDGVSSDPRFAGAVVVLDQEALASTLLDRAGRPLVHVDASANE